MMGAYCSFSPMRAAAAPDTQYVYIARFDGLFFSCRAVQDKMSFVAQELSAPSRH